MGRIIRAPGIDAIPDDLEPKLFTPTPGTGEVVDEHAYMQVVEQAGDMLWSRRAGVLEHSKVVITVGEVEAAVHRGGHA